MAVPGDCSVKPRVCVVSRNALLRSALTTLLEELGHVLVMDQREAEVTLVDLVDPAAPGTRAPNERAIALVRQGDDPLDLLARGFRGYLRLQVGPEDLERALAAVQRGEAWAERWALERLALGTPEPTPVPTPRERQVLRHLAEGRSNRDIARLLGIAEATVKAHITSLFEKFSVSSRLELVVKQRDTATPASSRRRSA